MPRNYNEIQDHIASILISSCKRILLLPLHNANCVTYVNSWRKYLIVHPSQKQWCNLAFSKGKRNNREGVAQRKPNERNCVKNFNK